MNSSVAWIKNEIKTAPVSSFKSQEDHFYLRFMKEDLSQLLTEIGSIEDYWQAIALDHGIPEPKVEDVSIPERDTVDLVFSWSVFEEEEE